MLNLFNVADFEMQNASPIRDFFFFYCLGKLPSSATSVAPARDVTSSMKDSSQPSVTSALNLVSSAASAQPSATTTTSGSTSTPSTVSTSSPVTTAVKKQRPLLPKETAQAVQRAVVWNPTKFQTSSQKWHMQKMQRQQQQDGEQSAVQTRSPQQQNSSSSTRYQTRQAAKGIYTNTISHVHVSHHNKVKSVLEVL